MKKYFVFATSEWVDISANQHIGMADTPEEAIGLFNAGEYQIFQLFELINDRLAEVLRLETLLSAGLLPVLCGSVKPMHRHHLTPRYTSHSVHRRRETNACAS